MGRTPRHKTQLALYGFVYFKLNHWALGPSYAVSHNTLQDYEASAYIVPVLYPSGSLLKYVFDSGS